MRKIGVISFIAVSCLCLWLGLQSSTVPKNRRVLDSKGELYIEFYPMKYPVPDVTITPPCYYYMDCYGLTIKDKPNKVITIKFE